jgi:hypothetical protein
MRTEEKTEGASEGFLSAGAWCDDPVDHSADSRGDEVALNRFCLGSAALSLTDMARAAQLTSEGLVVKRCPRPRAQAHRRKSPGCTPAPTFDISAVDESSK